MSDQASTTEEPESDAQNKPRQRRWLKRLMISVLLLVVIVLATAAFILPGLNDYQADGSIQLSGLHDAVTIVRDEKGMPYVYATDMHDLLFAQGFVTAQDRMFQIHLMKLRAAGRLTELAGDVARDLDVQTRTIGIRRVAVRHAEMLSDATRDAFQAYVDGVNAFLQHCPDDLPLEFSLAGLQAEQWTIEDSLSLLYLMSWDTSANLGHEVVTQMLVDQLGLEKAAELFPVNINPDDPADTGESTAVSQWSAHPDAEPLSLHNSTRLLELVKSGPLHVGSNNWTTSPAMSAGDHAIVAGDPHLDPRMLPGIMYAAGYVAPGVRAVGAGVPGIPGFIIGRNEHVATAVTNNYGDVQDLYVETVDADNSANYLEGGRSIPFQVEKEILRIKDDSAADGFREEEVEIRFTRRGPVVSGVLKGIDTERVVTLRWAAVESMQPDIGLTDLLTARSVAEVDQAIGTVTSIVLNFVFADKDGNIAWRASGRLPLREPGTGTRPYVVDPDSPWQDNWKGWIPFEEMPHVHNPERGWLGTANHDTVPADFPYYYSSYAAPSFRYRRMSERIAEVDGGLSVDDHWSIQRDTKNLMAQAATPALIEALSGDPETKVLADVLSNWDFHDTTGQPGTTVFQSVYSEFAKAVYTDELGEESATAMLRNWYFWQERFLQMVLSGESVWFDDQSTEAVETMPDMIRRAGKTALARWTPQLGKDPRTWDWGRVHTMEFVNPIRRSGAGSTWLGTGALPVDGSGETLYRGRHSFSEPYEVQFAAALRMVVDFGDSDKVRAVLAGGSSGRTFSPHQKDQVAPYVSGELRHWWFSDQAIEEHAAHRLTLSP